MIQFERFSQSMKINISYKYQVLCKSASNHSRRIPTLTFICIACVCGTNLPQLLAVVETDNKIDLYDYGPADIVVETARDSRELYPSIIQPTTVT